jgi:hypothetical protein
MVAVGGGSVWVVNGIVERHAFLVHRLDPESGDELSTWKVPGDGVFGQVAAGDRLWVAGWNGDDYLLSPISFDGEVGQPLKIRPVAAMRAAAGSLWVLPTAPADLARYDEASFDRAGPITVGDVGQDLAVSGTHLWAASEDLVTLRISP